MLADEIYNPNYDTELIEERKKAKDLCFDFNNLRPSQKIEKAQMQKTLLGNVGENIEIILPYWSDYGYPCRVVIRKIGKLAE